MWAAYNLFPVSISLSNQPIFAQKLPVIVKFAFQNARPDGPAPFRHLLRRAGPGEFGGREKQMLLLHNPSSHTGFAPDRVLLVGLGEKNQCGIEKLRRAAGLATRRIAELGLERAAFEAPGGMGAHGKSADCAGALAEAILLASYRFRQFKHNEQAPAELKSVALCLPPDADHRAAEREVRHCRVAAEAANYAREISNLPGNVVDPEALAGYARKLARSHKLKCAVYGRAQLQRRGFGGLLAVGGGSARPPRLIVLEYRGVRAPGKPPVAIVGKAITFDSGGVSIKPSEKMDEMKFDKCGGVAVLGAMRAVAELKMRLNVIGVIAAAENMPSATSYRPGDILTSYKGTDKAPVTVEVLNTDAEGRIVLGDALVYARQRDPRLIIDLATLTGACVIALGPYAAGLMSNDKDLLRDIENAGETTGERVWPFPLWEEYSERIKSEVADIKNTGGREGGAITAAAFLKRYVGETPWAHLDIAGTAWTTQQLPYLAKGATGFGVRLLTELFRRWERQ
jgi:leucyl aminopeptidase